MASRETESGIPRTYGGSLRLAGQGADALARATTGLAFSAGKTVGFVSGAGISVVRKGCAKSKARRAELAAARRATADVASEMGTKSHTPIVVGAIAGLAMVGAGIALLKYRSSKSEASGEFDDEYDDDAQLGEGA